MIQKEIENFAPSKILVAGVYLYSCACGCKVSDSAARGSTCFCSSSSPSFADNNNESRTCSTIPLKEIPPRIFMTGTSTSNCFRHQARISTPTRESTPISMSGTSSTGASDPERKRTARSLLIKASTTVSQYRTTGSVEDLSLASRFATYL